MILLAYSLIRFIHIPGREFAINLYGFYLSFELTLRTGISLLVAGLTASGADWLMRDHPAQGQYNISFNWLLPALTALVIGLFANLLPEGWGWWLGLVAGITLLILILIAEYICIDPLDEREPLAAAGLIAVSYALFLVLATVLRAASSRLIFILPALTLAAGLVSLRSMGLRLQRRRFLLEAVLIAWITSHFIAALHYWPLSPISYGLLILGPTFAITSLFSGLIAGQRLHAALTEPVVALLLSWGIAFWIR